MVGVWGSIARVVICVTGGPAVGKAALRSPKRAIVAGPGNPPVVVDETADLDLAAKSMIAGAAYDNNLLCISEKEVFAVEAIFDKLLEAMALGLPCITTHLVNNALGAPENKAILLAEDAGGFAQQINRLLTEKALAADIAANGKQFVASSFSWKKSAEKLDQLFRSSQNR